MDSKVLFKRTARLAVTAGLAASMTLGSLPVAVFAEEETDSKPIIEQGTPAVDAPAEEQEAPKVEEGSGEKATEGEKSPAKESSTKQKAAGAEAPKASAVATVDGKDYETVEAAVEAANNSTADIAHFQLVAATSSNMTFTHKVEVTASSKDFKYTGHMRIEASGSKISNVNFELDSSKDTPEQSLVVSNNASDVEISGNTFTIPAGTTAKQHSSVWLEQGATSTLIFNNTFNIGQTNNSSVGVNLVGNKDKPIKDTKIDQNTVNAGPLGTNLADPSSMMFVVGNGNTQAGSYGITGLTVSHNMVRNKTGKSAVDSKVYGVSVTASSGTTVTINYFEGVASVAYSAWPGQGPNDAMTVTGNTFNTYAGFVMGDFVTEGGLTVGNNAPGEDLVNMFNGNSTSTTYSDPQGKTYPSVEVALNKGVTSLTLLRDAEENVVIPADKNVTLNLNGHKLTNVSTQVKRDANGDPMKDENNKVQYEPVPADKLAHTITNKGVLNIWDSSVGKTGVVDNVSNQKAALFTAEGSTTTLDGGTFKRSQEKGDLELVDGAWKDQPNGNTYYTIQNQGNLTINKGTVVQLLREGVSGHETDIAGNSSVITNGWYSGQPQKDGYQAKLTINGGTITGGKYLKNDSYGELVINGGTIKGRRAAVLNYNVATIKGGSFSTQDDATPVIWNYPYQENEKGLLAITGGTFTAGEGQYVLANSLVDKATSSGSIAISGGAFAGAFKINGNPDVAISGGSYTVAPDSKYVVPGSGLVKNEDGTFGVEQAKVTVADASKVKDGVYTYDVKDGKEITKADLLALATVNDGYGLKLDNPSNLAKLNRAIGAKDTSKTFEFTILGVKKGAAENDKQAEPLTITVKLVDSTSKPEPKPEPTPKPEPEPEPKPEPTPNPEPEAKYFTVTFVDGIASTEDATQKVQEGNLATKPADPKHDGYEFVGWYTSADFKELYNFDKPVTGDLTLYGGWHKVGSDKVTEPEDTQKPSEQKPEAQKPADKQDADKKALPQTGDNSAAPIAIVAGAGAVAIAAGAVALKRRKQE